jgi:hypothetical protein
MMLSGDTLAAELNRLGVPFVRGATRATVAAQPAALLANLASSPEARLRAAIIPLLLWRPRLASAAPVAVDRLSPDAQTVLKCYYTAALLLQSKYAGRLAALHAEDLPLTDYFSHQLGLMRSGRCDLRLAALARRQAALSGEAINWLGTYEHAADSFLSRQERACR